MIYWSIGIRLDGILEYTRIRLHEILEYIGIKLDGILEYGDQVR